MTRRLGDRRRGVKPAEYLAAIYESEAFLKKHSSDSPAVRYLTSVRWDNLVRRVAGVLGDDPNARYLEIGAGDGEGLGRLRSVLPKLSLIVGIDRLFSRIRIADRGGGSIHLLCADAEELPFLTGSFDVVIQSMVFSAVPTDRSRQRIASSIARVLKPAGVFISLDLRFPSLGPHRPTWITRGDIVRLFPWRVIESTTIGLIPSLARIIAPISIRACEILCGISPLRVYRLMVLRRST